MREEEPKKWKEETSKNTIRMRIWRENRRRKAAEKAALEFIESEII